MRCLKSRPSCQCLPFMALDDSLLLFLSLSLSSLSVSRLISLFYLLSVPFYLLHLSPSSLSSSLLLSVDWSLTLPVYPSCLHGVHSQPRAVLPPRYRTGSLAAPATMRASSGCLYSLSVFLWFCVCVCVCVCVCLCLSLPLAVCVCVCVSLSLSLSVCLYLWLCVCVSLSFSLSVCLSICLSVCLSVSHSLTPPSLGLSCTLARPASSLHLATRAPVGSCMGSGSGYRQR